MTDSWIWISTQLWRSYREREELGSSKQEAIAPLSLALWSADPRKENLACKDGMVALLQGPLDTAAVLANLYGNRI